MLFIQMLSDGHVWEGLQKHPLNVLPTAAESNALYKLRLYDEDSESLLAVLPQSGAEAELHVPLQWPAKGVSLQLKAIKAAHDNVHLLQVSGRECNALARAFCMPLYPH